MGKLEIFLRYLQAEHLPLDAAELTTTDLRAFLVHLRENVAADENNPMKPAQERGLSPNTIQGYARTLKAFFSWLAREGYVADSPARLLKIPKAPKVIIQTLNDSQIRKLVSVIDRKRPKGYRDYCIVLVLLDTGVRLSELVNLQVTDLDLERRGHFLLIHDERNPSFAWTSRSNERGAFSLFHELLPESAQSRCHQITSQEVVGILERRFPFSTLEEVKAKYF